MAGVMGKYDTPQPQALKRFGGLIGFSINLRESPSDTNWTGRPAAGSIRLRPPGRAADEGERENDTRVVYRIQTKRCACFITERGARCQATRGAPCPPARRCGS